MPASSLRLLLQTPLAVLIGLRWLAIAGQSVAVGVVHLYLGMALPLEPLFLVLLAQVAFNSGSMWFLANRRPGEFRDDHLALQLSFDTLALAVMLYFTGGSFNPFVSLFLVPLAIAAVMLPPAYTCGLVILTVFLYGSLMDSSIPLADPPSAMTSRLSLHLFGMWVSFIISACLIAGFVAYLSARLRQSLQALRNMREQYLRQEQILALGTLAAGTAHELGTPLATMAVVMADLEQDVPEAFKPDIRLMQQQIGLCKEALSRLVQEVRHGQAEARWMTVNDFVHRILRDFSLLHPAVRVDWQAAPLPEKAGFRVDRQLEQALLNLLDNAADASPGQVSLRAVIREGAACLEIADRGPGFPESLLRDAGQRTVSAEASAGMGIGLLLSNATVERHGGEVRVAAREGGGTRLTVIIPLREGQADG